MKRISRLVITVMALICSAGAAPAGDTFKDLPGVKSPEDQKATSADVVCSSRLERQRTMSPSFRRNGLAYRAYSCDYGRVTVRSSEEPDMIEYRKFRDRYRPQPSHVD